MKKSFLMLAAMLSCALVTLPSCGDDDPINEIKPEKPEPNKPEPEKPAEAKELTVEAMDHDKWVYVNLTDGTTETKEIDPIAGLYKGNGAAKVGQTEMPMKDVEVEVIRVEKDTVNLVFKNIAVGKTNIDAVTIGAKVEIDSINGGVGYVLAGGETITNTKFGDKEIEIKASGKGFILGRDVEVSMDFTPGSMPMSISATYKGKFESGVNAPSINWDIAFHRMNVKTNGGSALMTEGTDINALTAVPAGEFKEDELSNEITVDMSQMMAGKIGYATDYINPVLGSWVSMKGMPPTFTVKENVFVLKTANGKNIKLQFSDYTNEKGKGGYITFKYAEINK